MSLTIGRVGLDYAALGDPATVAHSGRYGAALDLTGRTIPNSPAAGAALRDQLLGLADNLDELVVAVTSTEDPQLPGWYRIRDVSAAYLPSTLRTGMVAWAVKLERVADYTSPLHESVLTTAWMYGGVSTLESSDATIRWAPAPSLDQPTGTSLSLADGSNLTLISEPADTPGRHLWTPSSPGSFYTGACHLRAGTYDPTDPNDPANPIVVGRSHLHGPSWQLDNGLVAVTIDDAGRIVCRWARQGTTHGWTPNRYFTLTNSGAAVLTTPAGYSVLRNAPEAVTLRIAHPRVWFDITIRRGVQHIECVASSITGDVEADTIAIRTAETASAPLGATAGYIHATAADTHGCRWWLGTPLAASADTTNGRLDAFPLDPVTLPFAIGYTTGTTADAGGDLAGYYSGTGEIVQAVRR